MYFVWNESEGSTADQDQKEEVSLYPILSHFHPGSFQVPSSYGTLPRVIDAGERTR